MADAFEDEAEQTVSIHEYLQDVEEQELEADLVLGGDDGKECTYTKGYMKRQAVFSCLTCTPDGNAGVCTGCSLSCHDGHEIVELWTKRKFRCDCGNSKYGDFYCKLFADKEPENTENSYNQNFKGAYCTCGRPYPDPDAEEQVEMIQCCICEDWLHENHLGLKTTDEIPRDDEGEPLYDDFICLACANVCAFLTLYPPTIYAPIRPVEASLNNKEQNVVGDAPLVCAFTGNLENGTCNMGSSNVGSSLHADSGVVSNGKAVMLEETPDKDMGTEGSSLTGVSSPKCTLGVDMRIVPTFPEVKKPMFLSKIWRDLLCRCETCVDFYGQKGIGFLIDNEDTIVEYEKMAKQKRQEKLQQEEGAELNFLNKLGHVEKIEILTGINDMKNELRSFMETFDSSKAITSDDVHQIFENLAKKRQRLL